MDNDVVDSIDLGTYVEIEGTGWSVWRGLELQDDTTISNSRTGGNGGIK